MHMLNVFVAVGETQGFAAAANRMRLSPAAVTRAIAGLEKTLGVELLQRTTRNVRLTEAGRRYLEDIRHIVTEIDQVNDTTTSAPKGQLVVTAPEAFGKFFVMPCIADYLQRFPGVDVVASFDDRAGDLAEEGVDVSISIGALRDPGLISTRLGQVHWVLCASPAYLDRRGTPQHPGDLLHHAIIGLGEGSAPMEWKFAEAGGRMIMRLRPRLAVTTADAAVAAACSGMGIARLQSYKAGSLIAQGLLRPVLERYSEGVDPVHLLRRERGRDVPKISHFTRLMVERLANDPHLQ
ncbi:MAG: LysR family transcriptional regulator [Massilia sp.]